MAGAVVDAVDVLPAGVGDLLHRLGHLDLRKDDAVLLHCGDLVYAAEDGVALGGDEPLAHSESIDASALVYDGGYGVLVEAVGGHDLAVLQAGGVQHLPDLLGQIREVAGVQTDALEALPHRFEDLLGAADGVGGARP